MKARKFIYPFLFICLVACGQVNQNNEIKLEHFDDSKNPRLDVEIKKSEDFIKQNELDFNKIYGYNNTGEIKCFADSLPYVIEYSVDTIRFLIPNAISYLTIADFSNYYLNVKETPLYFIGYIKNNGRLAIYGFSDYEFINKGSKLFILTTYSSMEKAEEKKLWDKYYKTDNESKRHKLKQKIDNAYYKKAELIFDSENITEINTKNNLDNDRFWFISDEFNYEGKRYYRIRTNQYIFYADRWLEREFIVDDNLVIWGIDKYVILDRK